MSLDETFSEAWQLRFGEAPPIDLPELSALARHRSVRHYSDREVPRELVAALLGTGAAASTSSSLQLWSVISVEDAFLRQEIAKAAGDQDHVREAPWLLVFVVDHHRLRLLSERLGSGGEGLDYTEFFAMGVVDAALIAERFTCAAETLGLGVCYIGAMRNDPKRIQALLHLPEGTFAVFGLCLGYPSATETEEIKPRLDLDSFWFANTYGNPTDLDRFESRMAEHYANRGLKPGVTWAMRSARRTDEHHLTGREVLREFLQGQGFNRR